MNDIYFGNVLKELRIKKKMSQEKLADGICTKRQLIRIEQNENLPTGFLLSELSKKLNENLEPFLLLANHQNPMEVIELKETLSILFYEQNFTKILQAINDYKISHPDLPSDFLQYLGWYEGIAKSALPTEESPTIEYYINLLKLTMSFSDLKEACTGFRTRNELNILHTIITTFYLNQLIYDKAIELLPLLTDNYLQYYHDYDVNLLGRMYHNLSNLYYRLERYDEAFEHCNKGIEFCIREGSFSIVADLYLCKAGILAETNSMDEANECAKYFITIYEMLGKRNKIEFMIQQMKSDGFNVQ